MSDPIRCFLLEPTTRERVYLRRYCVSGANAPGGHYHSALSAVIEERDRASDGKQFVSSPGTADVGPDDPRWPVFCSCGYGFNDMDIRQVFTRSIWRRADTGEFTTIEEAPIGAIWDATWFHGGTGWCGPDGLALICKTPGGEWHIDGIASNCTQPNRPHKCWIRHGVAPDLTVDKAGDTCEAGAGSILIGGWHGFLRNGHLIPA